jgi:hypothetical protein
MPLKTYPPELTVEMVTAGRRFNSAGGCTIGGSNPVVETTSVLKSVSSRTASGWITPNWRKMKNEGSLLPFTPWSRFELKGRATLATREWCNGSGQRSKWENFYRGGTDVNQGESFFMGKVSMPDLNYFVQQAAASIYSSNFDALTFIAELSQLRRMLTGVGSKLLSLTKGKSPGRIADLWLEGRYGWRTLRYDIDDFVDYLDNVNAERTRYRQAKGLSTNGNWSEYSTSTSSGLTTGISKDLSWNINARGTVVADIEVPGLRFNPLTTGWEVTRLSFVVDWLLNVGQSLEALSFLLLTKRYVAGVGYKVVFDYTVTHSHVSASSGFTVFGNEGVATAAATVVSRSAATVGLKPNLKLRLDPYKVVDLFALVLQRLH